MIVQFWLREPGAHRIVSTLEIDAVPCAGDGVVIDPNGRTYPVHEVTFDFSNPRKPVARVLLAV